MDIWLWTIDNEEGNQLLLTHGLLFLIFYIHNPIDSIAHSTAIATPVVEYMLE